MVACRYRALGILLGISLPVWCSGVAHPASATVSTCQSTTPNFLVMAGGGAPSYNEIALEKNVLYFQRTLKTLGFDPAAASTYFANGTDGQATVRYLNGTKEQFKPPEIPHLAGASTRDNFYSWMQQASGSVFFYFTGHGYRNPADSNNNAMILWGEDPLSVQEFTTALDQLPATTPVVTMMSQCYSGSFANLIYEGGDPKNPVTLRTRCGFFATVKTRTSVGCTAEVNEADYRDYSSSFFAGLSGRDRTGKAVASADYDQDGRVSYAEAHAFAKVDEQSTDLPVSTLEVWLQEQAGETQQQLLNQPMEALLSTARPEQKYVVETLTQQLDLDAGQSFRDNMTALSAPPSQNDQAYLVRLGMELVNIGMEQQLRAQGDSDKIAVIERLVNCESGAWK
ncbi:MAG: caspase family protein [Pegethrix bostrychoides GSE-TBD4-15B]|uniref:Caspase family protein n=1 Tax=Pegethrix bostrychoides GSE-TBD4-15B TaxID=2839662 RepID=A0A951PGW6_9CYAN|nr:caspase family protein [Pegethrix bostrychoides GSE-TBD4-15B]